MSQTCLKIQKELKMYKYSIASCARWEDPYIVEWIEYHLSIGVEHFYIYSNDDDVFPLYDTLSPYITGKNPVVTLRHFPFIGQQRLMYLSIIDLYASETEWICFLDVDEFISLRSANTIPEFISNFSKNWDSIYFNWIFFGNNGFKTRPSGSVLRQYWKRQESIHPYTKSFTKTKFINSNVIKESGQTAFWHGWDIGTSGSDLLNIRACNVLEEPMREYYNNFPTNATEFLKDPIRTERILNTAIIQHYAFKSEEDFTLRVSRSNTGEFNGQSHWATLAKSGKHIEFLAVLNSVEDRTLYNYHTANMPLVTEIPIILLSNFTNLAPNGIASQSSYSEFSIGEDLVADAKRAINGNFASSYAFHTALENNPWWKLDLGQYVALSEIRIYNRIETSAFARRAKTLYVAISEDDISYEEIYQNHVDNYIGGIDGYPLLISNLSKTTRYIKIGLKEHNYFHLLCVEVY